MFTSKWSSARSCKLFWSASFVVLLMFTLPHFIATTSGAYKLAVGTARQTPQFTEALGRPVSEAWFSDGKTEYGNPTKAELMIPVKGSRQKGDLRVLAIEEDGRWRLTELTLELTQPDKHIDLLSKPPI